MYFGFSQKRTKKGGEKIAGEFSIWVPPGSQYVFFGNKGERLALLDANDKTKNGALVAFLKTKRAHINKNLLTSANAIKSKDESIPYFHPVDVKGNKIIYSRGNTYLDFLMNSGKLTTSATPKSELDRLGLPQFANRSFKFNISSKGGVKKVSEIKKEEVKKPKTSDDKVFKTIETYKAMLRAIPKEKYEELVKHMDFVVNELIKHVDNENLNKSFDDKANAYMMDNDVIKYFHKKGITTPMDFINIHKVAKAGLKDYSKLNPKTIPEKVAPVTKIVEKPASEPTAPFPVPGDAPPVISESGGIESSSDTSNFGDFDDFSPTTEAKAAVTEKGIESSSDPSDFGDFDNLNPVEPTETKAAKRSRKRDRIRNTATTIKDRRKPDKPKTADKITNAPKLLREMIANGTINKKCD